MSEVEKIKPILERIRALLQLREKALSEDLERGIQSARRAARRRTAPVSTAAKWGIV